MVAMVEVADHVGCRTSAWYEEDFARRQPSEPLAQAVTKIL
jgi:hypothetical protein